MKLSKNLKQGYKLFYRYWRPLGLFIGALAVFYFLLSNFPVDLDGRPFKMAEGQLVVNFGHGEQRRFVSPISEEQSVLLALYGAARAGGFDFKYNLDSRDQIQVQAIDGRLNFGKKHWNFYLNSQLINSQDLHQIKTRRGDIIEIKYETIFP